MKCSEASQGDAQLDGRVLTWAKRHLALSFADTYSFDNSKNPPRFIRDPYSGSRDQFHPRPSAAIEDRDLRSFDFYKRVIYATRVACCQKVLHCADSCSDSMG